MAQIRYRANLSAKDFVFSSQDWGRSIVMKQYDQNFSRQIVSPSDPDKDIGIPQIFYGHNIMPSAQGFQSVGMTKTVPATGVVGSSYQCFPWQANSFKFGYILITLVSSTSSNNTFNIYTSIVGIAGWTLQVQVVLPVAVNNRWTSAEVNGITYLLVPTLQCYAWDGGTWSVQTLTGLSIPTLLGITYAFGYMIAWSATSVAWSSTLSPVDFTPSLITGAGGGSIQGLKGAIVFCAHHTFGFIAFCQENCVAAVYSGNARYPFNFREIIGGGGFSAGFDLTSLDSESGNLYSYTTAGLQLTSVTQAQVVFPELTNFIGGSRFEDFNDATLTFSETDVAAGSIYKQLAVIAKRYLVISYGIIATTPTSYTHAIVYDSAMKRWGKLKFTHVQAVEFIWNDVYGVQESARQSLCLLATNGDIYSVDFSQAATTGGTIFLGKYQHARDRLITLQQVDIDYIPGAGSPALNVFPTYDGKTFIAPTLVNPISVNSAPQYPCRITGMNISLCFQGVFRLDSLMLTYSASGRR